MKKTKKGTPRTLKYNLNFQWTHVDTLKEIIDELPPDLILDLGKTEARRALLRLIAMQEAEKISKKKSQPQQSKKVKR